MELSFELAPSSKTDMVALKDHSRRLEVEHNLDGCTLREPESEEELELEGTVPGVGMDPEVEALPALPDNPSFASEGRPGEELDRWSVQLN